MSAIIDNVEYDKDAKELSITFVQGGTWTYENVPESVYTQLLNAPSRGKYFWANIRDKFSNSQV